jgi:hypothetical protein
MRSGWVKGNLWRAFEPLSRQTTQLISKFNRNGIHLQTGALIPMAQGWAHFGREEVANRFMHPGRVNPFEHCKPVVGGNDGIDGTQIAQRIANFAEMGVITLLQLQILKNHNAPSMVIIISSHFPRYFSGLRIRSSRSASSLFRAVPCFFRLIAIATD